MMMRPDLGSTNTGEKAFRLICAGTIVRISFGMINAFRQVTGMERSQPGASSAWIVLPGVTRHLDGVE